MDLEYLTPALEQLWLDEVHHLRTLSRDPNPNPYSHHESTASPNLRPVNSTAFKKENRRKRRERKWQKKQEELQQSLITLQDQIHPSDPGTVSNIDWPCETNSNSNPKPEPTGWTVPNRNPAAAAQPRPPPSAEEQVRIAALQAQQNSLRACQDFFSKSDEEEEEEDAMDEDDGESFKFFVELFEKDGDLRTFYEKNWEKGGFCCLVCGGIGEKLGKKFVNCVGLVQHSNTISKTKRKGAHRSFGRAVCRVLGWDINRLPGIVSDLGDHYRQSLAIGDNKAEDMQKETDIIEKEWPQKGSWQAC